MELSAVSNNCTNIVALTEVLSRCTKHSLYEVFFDPKGKVRWPRLPVAQPNQRAPSVQFTKGRLYFFYYINYLFKLLEFIDTWFLVLRYVCSGTLPSLDLYLPLPPLPCSKKPVIFLHIYHHAATAFLCWSQMAAQSCMQWCV